MFVKMKFKEINVLELIQEHLIFYNLNLSLLNLYLYMHHNSIKYSHILIP